MITSNQPDDTAVSVSLFRIGSFISPPALSGSPPYPSPPTLIILTTPLLYPDLTVRSVGNSLATGRYGVMPESAADTDVIEVLLE
jgi:hypothetical protein